MNLKKELKKVLDIEAAAILKTKSRIDGDFEKAVGYMLACKGKIVISGIGKSGLIGQKIAATLSSPGRPRYSCIPRKPRTATWGWYPRMM